ILAMMLLPASVPSVSWPRWRAPAMASSIWPSPTPAGRTRSRAIVQGDAVMTDPVIIAVAITGSVPRQKDNPAVPVTVTEQIESTHACFEAGASLAHIHVRNKDESPSSDPALFAEVQAGIRKHCPGMIIQFSTGGRGREQAARGAMLGLRPDMASL